MWLLSRSLVSVALLTLMVASACGADDVEVGGQPVTATENETAALATPSDPESEPLDVEVAPRSTATSTVPKLSLPPATAFELDLPDHVDPDDPTIQDFLYVADTAPLPPDGGELVDCADVPELESRVEGTMGGRQNLDPIVSGILATYAFEHRDTYGGRWIDRAHGGSIVLTFTDDPAVHLEALLARSPSRDDIPAIDPAPPITDHRPLGERDDVAIDVLQVEFTEAQLRSTQNHLTQYMGEDFGLLGSGVSIQKNRLLLNFVDPPPGAIEAFAEVLPTAATCISVIYTPEPPTGPLQIIPDLEIDDPLVSCSGLPELRYSDFINPTPIAALDHPAVDALRTELASPGVEPLPVGEWVVFTVGDDLATFGAQSDRSFGYATFERAGDSWTLRGWGEGPEQCDSVVVLPDGLETVELRLRPDALPAPEDTTVQLLATERACANAREMGDALIGPQVVETEAAVLIAFGVIPVVGGATCPGNPSTLVEIELAEPLGDRQLLDGLHLPPAPITVG